VAREVAASAGDETRTDLAARAPTDHGSDAVWIGLLAAQAQPDPSERALSWAHVMRLLEAGTSMEDRFGRFQFFAGGEPAVNDNKRESAENQSHNGRHIAVQKYSLKAPCITRGATGPVLRILPTSELVTEFRGVEKLGVLNALNISQRNWRR
jgi:hypothetical protein